MYHLRGTPMDMDEKGEQKVSQKKGEGDEPLRPEGEHVTNRGPPPGLRAPNRKG